MAGFRKLISEAAKLFYLGVGISDPGTIPRKVDLWKISSGESWRVRNRTATNLQYKGKEAVRFEAQPGEGLAIYDAIEFFGAKVDINLAGINQHVGLIVRAKDEVHYEVVTFQVQSEPQALHLTIGFGEAKERVVLPADLAGEWISVRVVLAQLYTAVFLNNQNVPTLKVSANPPYAEGGWVGFWMADGSEALLADLKYIQTRKKNTSDLGA